MQWLRVLALSLFTGFCVGALAQNADEEIESILKQEKPPSGVVFELVSGDADMLKWAIPAVENYAERLRDRFPKLSVAVVSHGNEQFSLATNKRKQNKTLHKKIQSLTQDSDIQVHVCGVNAEWRDMTPEDFPDYVDVSPDGPAQIIDYVALGYVHVQIDEFDGFESSLD